MPLLSGCKRKVRQEITMYPAEKKRKRSSKDHPKTSARPLIKKRENLTLHDWMTVFEFIDKHPTLSQEAIIRHFSTLKDNALHFSQGTLSRNLKRRSTLEERVEETPNALSSKRPRIVTRPDVEEALFLWVKHMESKNEGVNGAMLVAKRRFFEEKFDVPDEERLTSQKWIDSFKRAYKIQEHRRHGEAGSVDRNVVEKERKRLQELLAKYSLKNLFNFDETSLFTFAAPDRALTTQQMSGKKKDKFRITIGVGCNGDGSEKLPLFFIGKSKMPRCFNKKSPAQRGFYYRNNAKAWMTGALFEEWLKELDIQIRSAGRTICLLLDNFSGHSVSYKPTNIHIEFFSPNLTSFVQPCDAGIIRCLKAKYRNAFCLRALGLDDVGAEDIYKIDLLEAMLMVRSAWSEVTMKTIKNCWAHTQILPSFPMAVESVKSNGWDIIRDFAVTDMGLPEAEDRLKEQLGAAYVDTEWRPALNAVMDAENDTAAALQAIAELSEVELPSSPPVCTTLSSYPSEIQVIEEELLDSMNTLKKRRAIRTLLTLEEMLNPVEEQVIGESGYDFPGGDDEIVETVKMNIAVRNGEVIEIQSDTSDEDAEHEETELSRTDVMKLCLQLESASLKHGNFDKTLQLTQLLRGYRGHLMSEQMKSAKQATLTDWLKSQVPN